MITLYPAAGLKNNSENEFLDIGAPEKMAP
jgi:hypothetical protein